MTSKTLNHLRVVMHVNEEDSEDENITFQNTRCKSGNKAALKRNSNGQIVTPANLPIQPLNDTTACENMKAQILIIDDKSLQLNLMSTEESDGPYINISHKMRFDHVSHSAFDMLKKELAIVIDNLLVKQKNSCIMRFTTKQEIGITEFFDLFIIFLNKRIQHEKYKLQYVKLECLDIAAGVGGSKICPTENGFAMKGNIAGLSENSDEDGEAMYRFPKNGKNEFRSTRGLIVWLLNEYRFKFADSKGHEKLQFTFSVINHHQNIFKVKFTLFNIFLNLMNTEDRNHWHKYMDHIGEGCKGMDCRFMHSGLTISLSSHIEGSASDTILLFFDVSTSIAMTADTIEMLQMADSVIKNRKKKLLLLSKYFNLHRRSLSSNSSKCRFPTPGEEIRNNLPANHKQGRLSLPMLVKQERMDIRSPMLYGINQTIKNHYNYSSDDFNTLSAWYSKIDTCFEKYCQLREKYFNHYFKLKTKQIASCIKNMYSSLESLYSQQKEQNLVEFREDQTELRELFRRYNNVQALFSQLSEDIKDTNFAPILNIYLETKTFDLNNHALVLKKKHTESCQQYLNLIFDNLFSDIKLELAI